MVTGSCVIRETTQTDGLSVASAGRAFLYLSISIWGKAGRGRGPRGVRGRGWQRHAPCVCRLFMGCARAGLILGTRREWLVAIKLRAGWGVLERHLRNEEGGEIHGSCARASGFDGRAADSSSLRVVLLLSASASAMPPSGPSSLSRSLRTRRRKGEKEQVQRTCVLCGLKVWAVGSMVGQQTRASRGWCCS